MRFAKILDLATVKILLYLLERKEVRYTQLADLIRSRGTLTLCLQELEEDKLVNRRVVTARPIQAYYSLSEKGQKLGAELLKVKDIVER